ncbi:MAG: hypothetical protein WCT04_00160 [Planctomycetota bacterium]
MAKKAKRDGGKSTGLDASTPSSLSITPEKMAEINSRALDVLMKKLGARDCIHFMSQQFSGKKNYSRDRHKTLPKLTLEELAAMSNRSAS